MRIKTALKSVAAAAVAAALAIGSGCVFYDLGDFEEEEDYYASFGNIGLIAQNETRSNYSVEQYFYNEKSVNDFGGDIVAPDEYIYFVLPFTGTVTLESFALFAHSEKAGTVEYSLFVTDTLPSGIRNYDAPLLEQETDGEGNPKFDEEGNPVYKEIEYDDPTAEDAVCTGSFTLKAEEWGSFTADKWKADDGSFSRSTVVQSGSYLLVRFENNSGSGKDRGLEKLSVSLTNLLVRVSQKAE